MLGVVLEGLAFYRECFYEATRRRLAAKDTPDKIHPHESLPRHPLFTYEREGLRNKRFVPSFLADRRKSGKNSSASKTNRVLLFLKWRSDSTHKLNN